MFDTILIYGVAVGALWFLVWFVRGVWDFNGPRRIYRTEPDGTRTLIGWTD